jgi:epoxyqueuosine reductase
MQTALFTFVQDKAIEAGFDRVGVCPASDPQMLELARFAPWIEAGFAGEMDYLKRRNDAGEYKRSSLEQALPWAHSVIVTAINYNPPAPKSVDPAPRTSGWISRYAQSPADYHDTVMAKLRTVESELIQCLRASQQKEVTTRCYVDTGPIVERVYAKYANMGWIGKNTCLIDEKLGSWFFLGVMVTSIPFNDFISDGTLNVAEDRCGSCTRCIDACPTQALVAPHQLDASRCIAYFTIEKRGAIPEEMRHSIGRHVFGCDICQDVCPWNRKAPIATDPGFQPDPTLINPELEELAHLSAEEFRSRFRGSPISRAKHSGFLRNVAVAMGNSGERQFIPTLEQMSSSKDPVLAEHARWALDQLAH